MNSLRFLSVVVMLIIFTSCEKPTEFSENALNDVLESIDENEVLFKDVIDQFKGQKVVIDVWASWCGDCIKGLPKVKQLQTEYPKVKFLFLSLDRNKKAWKNAIKKHDISGAHYYLTSGSDGAFRDFLNSNWIPRYMVVNEQGDLTLFKATNINDKRIKKALQ